ncbi:hypothetical protein HMPREF2651_04070 [Corynebacterium sp. HMSC063A05]|nr:hypothetical protein HMPREF2651_04070 [Corynebacterium sp. HMSC063A05]
MGNTLGDFSLNGFFCSLGSSLEESFLQEVFVETRIHLNRINTQIYRHQAGQYILQHPVQFHSARHTALNGAAEHYYAGAGGVAYAVNASRDKPSQWDRSVSDNLFREVHVRAQLHARNRIDGDVQVRQLPGPALIQWGIGVNNRLVKSF